MLFSGFLRITLLLTPLVLSLAGRLLMDAFDDAECGPSPAPAVPVDLLDLATQLDMAAGGKLSPITR